MKYRYVITHEGTVEAATPAEAEVFAFEQVEAGGSLMVVTCDVEPLSRKENEG